MRRSRFAPSPSLLPALVAVALCATAPLPADADDWPQWRGPDREGVSRETGLLKEWPEEGPPVVWRVANVGVGYSSLAIAGGRIYTQGDLDGVEHALCLDAKDGRLVWAVQPEPVAAGLGAQVDAQLKRLDTDGDGRLSEVEVLQGLGTGGLNSDRAEEGDAKTIAADRAARLFAALDADQSGRLDETEAGQGLHREFANIDQADDTADADALAAGRAAGYFEALDANSDGRISKEEAKPSRLRQVLEKADQKLPGEKKGDGTVTLAELTAYLLKREKARDGLLTQGELTEYYARRFPGRDGILTAVELRGHLGGYRNGQGDGPRGTPTVDGDRVYVEGGNGDVTCLDAATGKTLWHVSLTNDLDGGRPGWGYSESPLVEGNLLIVTPGGKQGTVAALDKKTARVVWRSEGVTEGAQYASPIVAELAGLRQIVVFARNNVFGVRIDDGKQLWSYGGANNGTANCTTPVAYRDHVFAASAYGTGGGLAHIVASGDGQRADEVYFEKKMANHHGGIVRVGEHLYGYGSGLICMHALTGEIAWADRSVGKGSLVAADGMLYVLSEGHKLALVEATPEEYREHGRFELEPQGRPSWAHPVVANGRLYIRDQQTLTAYDVKAKK